MLQEGVAGGSCLKTSVKGMASAMPVLVLRMAPSAKPQPAEAASDTAFCFCGGKRTQTVCFRLLIGGAHA